MARVAVQADAARYTGGSALICSGLRALYKSS
jgi:hypothetical protein